MIKKLCPIAKEKNRVSGSVKWLILIILTCFNASVFGLDENGQLAGGTTFIANDGAAEASENPAYLAFPQTEKTVQAVAVRTRASKMLQASISNLTNIESFSQTRIFGNVCYARYGVLGSRLSAGFCVGDMQDAAYSNLKIKGPVKNQPGVNTSYGAEETQYSTALGLGYQISENESFGFQIFYRGQKYIEKSGYLMANLNMGPGITGNYYGEKYQNSKRHELTATLSYLLRKKDSDISIAIGNAGYSYGETGHVNSDLTTGSVGPGMNFSDANQYPGFYIDKTYTDPYLSISMSQALSPNYKVYLETILQPQFRRTTSDNAMEEDYAKQIYNRKISRTGDMAMSLSLGLSASPIKDWTFHAGTRAQFEKTNMTYTTEGFEWSQNQYSDNQLIYTSLGASYRMNQLVLSSGAIYEYYRSNKSSVTTATTFTGTQKSTDENTIEMRALGLFISATYDLK